MTKADIITETKKHVSNTKTLLKKPQKTKAL